MLYQITNLTHSSKAFRSVNSGEMVFIPPHSEGTYDLAPLASLDFAGLEIKDASGAPAAEAVVVAPPVAPVVELSAANVEIPVEVQPKASKKAPAVEPGPAPWQQGLANSVKA